MGHSLIKAKFVVDVSHKNGEKVEQYSQTLYQSIKKLVKQTRFDLLLPSDLEIDKISVCHEFCDDVYAPKNIYRDVYNIGIAQTEIIYIMVTWYENSKIPRKMKDLLFGLLQSINMYKEQFAFNIDNYVLEIQFVSLEYGEK